MTNKKVANPIGWHIVKLDDQSYRALTEYRNRMIATGRHASYSDAVRKLMDFLDDGRLKSLNIDAFGLPDIDGIVTQSHEPKGSLTKVNK